MRDFIDAIITRIHQEEQARALPAPDMKETTAARCVQKYLDGIVIPYGDRGSPDPNTNMHDRLQDAMNDLADIRREDEERLRKRIAQARQYGMSEDAQVARTANALKEFLDGKQRVKDQYQRAIDLTLAAGAARHDAIGPGNPIIEACLGGIEHDKAEMERKLALVPFDPNDPASYGLHPANLTTTFGSTRYEFSRSNLVFSILRRDGSAEGYLDIYWAITHLESGAMLLRGHGGWRSIPEAGEIPKDFRGVITDVHPADERVAILRAAKMWKDYKPEPGELDNV